MIPKSGYRFSEKDHAPAKHLGVTDYYPLLASVVAALEPNTAEARRQLYESARVGFPNYLGNLEPKLSDAEVTRERTALEEVIRRLEAEQMAVK
jgi:hypothetical protein